MSTCGSTSSKALGVLGPLLLGGCALIMDGTTQEVSFTSDPPGARFSVGGRAAETPLKLDVAKEDYTIVFSKPGYHPREFQLKRETNPWFYASLVMGVISSSVDILSGAWQQFQTDLVHVVLEPLPETRIEERPVKIASTPAGAEVLVDDAVQGRTPLELKLGWRVLEEEKRVTFRLASYHPKTVSLRRLDPELGVALEAVPVTVKVHFVSVPPGADVRVEGRGVGKTPVYHDVTWVPGAVPKAVEFSREGYRTERRSIASAAQAKVEAELPEVFEETPLVLKVSPAGAHVEVDGSPATGLPLRWSVSLQRHSVRVSHPGYRPQARDVTFDERKAPLEITLQPLLPKSP